MATPEDRSEDYISPTADCPAWCIDHDADGPDEADDHLHEATPALVRCIVLERSTDTLAPSSIILPPSSSAWCATNTHTTGTPGSTSATALAPTASTSP